MCSVDPTLCCEDGSNETVILRLITSLQEVGSPSTVQYCVTLLLMHLKSARDPKVAFTEVGVLIKAV